MLLFKAAKFALHHPLMTHEARRLLHKKFVTVFAHSDIFGFLQDNFAPSFDKGNTKSGKQNHW